LSDSSRRLAALGLATLLVCATLAYAAVWAYTARWQPAADLGVEFAGRTLEFASVVPGSPAEQAGLKRYDLLTALDGEPLESLLELRDRLRLARPGDPVSLTVRLSGLNEPQSYDSTLIASPASRAGLKGTVPLLLTLLIAGVLFARAEYLNAWLLALTLVGIVGATPLMSMYERIPPDLRGPAVGWKILAAAIGPGFLYLLFAVLPERSPFDRRLPWLRAWPAAAAVVALPFALYAFTGDGVTFRDGALPAFGTFVLVLSWVAALGLGTASLLAAVRETPSEADLRSMPLVLLRRVAERIGLRPIGDARCALQELARDVAATSHVEELVQRLERGIGRALRPVSFALYFTHGDRLIVEHGDVPEELREIPLDQPLVEDESGDDARTLESLDTVTPFGPDQLVPLIGSDGPPLLGLMVLGPRSSDEPYSAEEKRLLASVGRHAAAAVEAGTSDTN